MRKNKSILSLLFFILTSSHLYLFAEDKDQKLSYENQVNAPEKHEPLMLTEFSFGPKWLLTHNTNVRSYFFVSFAGHHEIIQQVELNYRVTGSFNTKFTGGELMGTLGAAYLPFTGNFTPYVGIDFGFGFMAFNHNGQNYVPLGFVGSLRSGTRLFRLSKNQLDLSVAGTFLFRKVDGTMPFCLDLRLALLI